MSLSFSHLVIFLLLGESLSQYCPSYCDDIPPDLFPQQLECELIKATGQCTRPEIVDNTKFCRCSCGACPIEQPTQNSTTSYLPIKVQKSKTRMEEIELMNKDMNTYIPFKSQNFTAYNQLGRAVDNNMEEFAPIQGPCSCYDEPPVGSTYTCLEMFMDDKCEVLLEYKFCECTCGKCAGRMQEILSDQVFDSDFVQGPQLMQSVQSGINVNLATSDVDNLIGNPVRGILDDTQQIQDTFYSISNYDLNFTIKEMDFDSLGDEPATIDNSPPPDVTDDVITVSNKTSLNLWEDLQVKIPAPQNISNVELNQTQVELQIADLQVADDKINSSNNNNNQTNNETLRINPEQNDFLTGRNSQNFSFSYTLVQRDETPLVEEEQDEQLDQSQSQLINNKQNTSTIIINDDLPQKQQMIQQQDDNEDLNQLVQPKSIDTRPPSSRFYESSAYEGYNYPPTTVVLPTGSQQQQQVQQSSSMVVLAQPPSQLLPIAISSTNNRQQQIFYDVDVQDNCVDIEPPSSQMRCPLLKQQGRCTQSWMQGYCEVSCGTCVDNNIFYDNDIVNIDNQYNQFSQNSLGIPISSIDTPVSQLSVFDFEEEPQSAVCLSACNENPPPKSEFSCVQQKNMGKCDRAWMKGYCECSCETCDAFFHTSDVPLSSFNYSSQFQVPIWDSQSNVQNFEGDFFLTVLHFNDIHARVEPTTEWWWECEPWRNEQGDCFGGFARMKTIVDMERQIDPNLLLLDGGDDFVGSQWDYYDPANKATAHFFSLMGVDAMTLGNHEFDHGPDVLVEHILEAQYPFLSCNMDASLKPSLDQITQKYVVKQVKGRKVGIFGLTTTYTNTAEAADPYPVWFDEPYQAARECIQELQNLNVDIIIALSHLGYSADRYLVREVNGIDLVIGAHSHSFLANENDIPVLNITTGQQDTPLGQYPTWEQSPDGTSVPVVQAGWASRYMGKIQIRLNQNGKVVAAQGQPILLGGSASGNLVVEDQLFVQEIQSWKWW